jgi:hypothetical protein
MQSTKWIATIQPTRSVRRLTLMKSFLRQEPIIP